ncbi:MAG: cyclase family protein [Clostridia bacterium]|nr:cyclase family protein [Clostridia bacterium]
MKVIDLTHFISEDMPVYPGTESPVLAPANTYDKDGFKETRMTMYTHTGTHMDPPAHLFDGRTTLDQFSVEQFVGRALVIDCSDLKDGERVPLDRITRYGSKADEADFLLFRFGWDKHWGTPAYFGNYPYLSDEAVDHIIRTQKKGVGLDVIGIDPIADANLTIHRRLFAKNEIVVIENLMNLDRVGDELFWLMALPLKHVNADGSPIRAIAFWP